MKRAKADGAALEAKREEAIGILRVRREEFTVKVRGLSPLIMHRWPEKAKQEMRDKQMGKAKTKKAPKDPDAIFEACQYRFDDGKRLGIPCLAFKKACISAVRHVDGMAMTEARGAFFITGEYSERAGYPLTEITAYKEMVCREDPVRVGRGTADLRYRPEVREWEAMLNVELYGSTLTPEQFLGLLDIAGHMVGVLDWRPERGGDFGRFELVED